MNDSEKLRQDRIVYYSAEIGQIQAVLQELVSLSGARCALLVDKEGHMVSRTGDAGSFDVDTISALVAGSFAATREMARLLGEEEFSIVFHQGRKDNIQLSLVGNRAILTVIFDEATTVGMVRLYASDASQKILEVFNRVAEGGGDPAGTELEEDYDAAAGKARLDSLFS